MSDNDSRTEVAASMQPFFEHDGCEACVYLGPFGEHEGAVTHDLWFCPQAPGIPTVMARYGNDGPDYHSGLTSTLPPMVEAKKRAVRRGLLASGSGRSAGVER